MLVFCLYLTNRMLTCLLKTTPVVQSWVSVLPNEIAFDSTHITYLCIILKLWKSFHWFQKLGLYLYSHLDTLRNFRYLTVLFAFCCVLVVWQQIRGWVFHHLVLIIQEQSDFHLLHSYGSVACIYIRKKGLFCPPSLMNASRRLFHYKLWAQQVRSNCS